jgi:hypothetical protein
MITVHACRCGHCKHLVPVYKELGEAIAKDPSLKNRVVIAKVGKQQRRLLLLSVAVRFLCRAAPVSFAMLRLSFVQVNSRRVKLWVQCSVCIS